MLIRTRTVVFSHSLSVKGREWLLIAPLQTENISKGLKVNRKHNKKIEIHLFMCNFTG